MEQRVACGQAILRYSVKTQPPDIVRAGRVRIRPEKPNPMNEGFISCFLLENARPNHAFGVISGGFRQVPAASQNSPPSGSGCIQNGFSVQALDNTRWRIFKFFHFSSYPCGIFSFLMPNADFYPCGNEGRGRSRFHPLFPCNKRCNYRIV